MLIAVAGFAIAIKLGVVRQPAACNVDAAVLQHLISTDDLPGLVALQSDVRCAQVKPQIEAAIASVQASREAARRCDGLLTSVRALNRDQLEQLSSIAKDTCAAASTLAWQKIKSWIPYDNKNIDVAELLKALATLGIYHGKTDAAYGPSQRAALNEWQRSNSYPSTDTMVDDGWARLFRDAHLREQKCKATSEKARSLDRFSVEEFEEIASKSNCPEAIAIANKVIDSWVPRLTSRPDKPVDLERALRALTWTGDYDRTWAISSWDAIAQHALNAWAARTGASLRGGITQSLWARLFRDAGRRRAEAGYIPFVDPKTDIAIGIPWLLVQAVPTSDAFGVYANAGRTVVISTFSFPAETVSLQSATDIFEKIVPDVQCSGPAGSNELICSGSTDGVSELGKVRTIANRTIGFDVAYLSKLSKSMTPIVDVMSNDFELFDRGDLADAPQAMAEYRPSGGSMVGRQPVGIQIQGLSDDVRSKYGVSADVNGVMIADVAQGSLAAAAGLAPGDVITTIDGRAITTIESVIATLDFEYISSKQSSVWSVLSDGHARQVSVALH